MRAAYIALTAVLVLTTGCAVKEPRSAIVEKAEASGSGPLSPLVSSKALERWLVTHPNPAREIEAMCRPVRATAAAAWADTTEGRLCAASQKAALFSPGGVTSDHKGFWPGDK